jgi:hypothetical protein
VVQIEQMRAHLKGLSEKIVMSSESMVTCASGLLPNPAKVPYFWYRAWWYSIVQKFHNEGKKHQDSQFWAYFGLRPWSGLSPKISKLGMMVFYRLEISYWWLKIFYFFSCPVTDQQPKNVLPISVATRNFLFIWFLTSYRAAEKVQNDYLSSAWNFRSIEYHHALYLNFGTLTGLWPWVIGPSLKIEILGFFIITMKFLINRA